MPKFVSEEHRKNFSIAQKKRWSDKKLRLKQSKINKKKRSLETKDERQKYTPNNTNSYTIEYIKRTYPFFSKIEKMKYSNEKQIQIMCKQCKLWFTPTNTQLYSRIYALEKDYGNDGIYFYCSNECKNKCPVYNLKNYNINKNDDNNKPTTQELSIFNQTVLERDNYICQYCGRKANTVHHIRPQKLEPFFALDPENGITCCTNCHKTYPHKLKECTTGKLANMICS